MLPRRVGPAVPTLGATADDLLRDVAAGAASGQAVPLAARGQAPGALHAEPVAAGDVIGQLQVQWTKIINEAPENLRKTPAAALLRSARPVSMENDTLTVSIRHQYHKEKMDAIENQRTADRIVSSFLGRSCRVRCVYEHENNHLVKAALRMGAQVIDNGEGK